MKLKLFGLIFFLMVLLYGCGKSPLLTKFKQFGDEKYPYVPDTTDYPTLTFKWDYTLNKSTVEFIGPFGVTEANPPAPATEIEIHTKIGGDPIYALADGIVVEIQEKANPVVTGLVEGVWVRYGRNFMIKYTKVVNPLFKAGDIVKKGDIIGKVLHYGYGFYEVEIRILKEDKVYADLMLDYCDSASKQILLDLWNEVGVPTINQWQPVPYSPWRASEKIDVTSTVSPDKW